MTDAESRSQALANVGDEALLIELALDASHAETRKARPPA